MNEQKYFDRNHFNVFGGLMSTSESHRQDAKQEARSQAEYINTLWDMYGLIGEIMNVEKVKLFHHLSDIIDSEHGKALQEALEGIRRGVMIDIDEERNNL